MVRSYMPLHGFFIGSSLDQKVMVDPDAPNPSNPTLREYLHWYHIYILVHIYMVYIFKSRA
jgi:hypothetical protein